MSPVRTVLEALEIYKKGYIFPFVEFNICKMSLSRLLQRGLKPKTGEQMTLDQEYMLHGDKKGTFLSDNLPALRAKNPNKITVYIPFGICFSRQFPVLLSCIMGHIRCVLMSELLFAIVIQLHQLLSDNHQLAAVWRVIEHCTARIYLNLWRYWQ